MKGSVQHSYVYPYKLQKKKTSSSHLIFLHRHRLNQHHHKSFACDFLSRGIQTCQAAFYLLCHRNEPNAHWHQLLVQL
uniref:Serine/threonine-protein kinase prpf4B-like isoform X2 n=1 Tax=Rhizophora mucronata TaxID=61149 RepID=A0A2P2IJF5_RHIMU